MHFGSTNTHQVYNMNGAVLDSVSVEKDLGVLVDRNLNFSTHISSAVLKANRLLGLIKRCFRYLDMKGLKLLYTAIVRPHLEYANAVWHPRFKKDIKLLEKVQHRATRLIPELRSLPYEERLQRLKLPSLTYRRLRGDAIEVYKYIHGHYHVNTGNFLQPFDSKSVFTRGHDRKLLKIRCRTGLRSNYFTYRVVNVWNNLPQDIVNAPSLDTFKSRIDKHWAQLYYRTEG